MKTCIKKIIAAALLCCACTPGAIEITIEQGMENPIPVAVVPFAWSGETAAPVELAAIIGGDLERSGRFETVAARDLPQRPSQYRDINFRDWRLLGMENLVIGAVTPRGDGYYEVEFRLVDVYREKQLIGFRLTSSAARLRATAHEISDRIYEKLIGVRGAFATRIAYITVNERGTGGKRYALHIADADGHQPRILVESSDPLLSPSWSPDGARLAYVSFEHGKSVIFVQDIRSGGREQIAAHAGINSAPAWSPDGKRLAMTLSKDGDPEIYVMELDSGTLRRLTDNKGIDTEPAWSPDGRQLAFTSDRGGNPQIYQIPADGGKIRRLTFEGVYNARPSYSSDGRLLLMVTASDGAYRIGVLDLESGRLNTLTNNALDESPSFAPNDHMIIYATSSAEGAALAAVSTDGKVRQRLLLQQGEVREPAWGPFLPRQ